MPCQSLLKILLGLLSASMTKPRILTRKPRSASRSESISFRQSDSPFLLLQRDCLLPRLACAQPPPCDLCCFHLCLLHQSYLLPVQPSKPSRDKYHFLWGILIEPPVLFGASQTHIGIPMTGLSPHMAMGSLRARMPSYSSLWAYHSAGHSGCCLRE